MQQLARGSQAVLHKLADAVLIDDQSGLESFSIYKMLQPLGNKTGYSFYETGTSKYNMRLKMFSFLLAPEQYIRSKYFKLKEAFVTLTSPP